FCELFPYLATRNTIHTILSSMPIKRPLKCCAVRHLRFRGLKKKLVCAFAELIGNLLGLIGGRAWSWNHDGIAVVAKLIDRILDVAERPVVSGLSWCAVVRLREPAAAQFLQGRHIDNSVVQVF